jgi:hypothetical protein
VFAFLGSDIDDGDDRTVNPVVQGAIGKDFELVVYALAVG